MSGTYKDLEAWQRAVMLSGAKPAARADGLAESKHPYLSWNPRARVTGARP